VNDVNDDALAIGRLIDEYIDAVARGDAEAFGRCWTAEGQWTGPGLECSGIFSIMRTFAKMRERISAAEQTVVEGDVEIDGDRATGSWLIHEAIVDRDGKERERVGRYDDAYRRTREGWKFSARHFTPSE